MAYENYAGSAALLTAVDVGETAEALTALFADAGPAPRGWARPGQARAREAFDWRVVIPQYQALWAELGPPPAGRGPASRALENPYRPDPFRMFEAYPTAALARDDLVELARPVGAGEAAFLMDRPHGAQHRRPPAQRGRGRGDPVTRGRPPRSVGASLSETRARAPAVRRARILLDRQVRPRASARHIVAYLSATGPLFRYRSGHQCGNGRTGRHEQDDRRG